jgi:hypothetical protein
MQAHRDAKPSSGLVTLVKGDIVKFGRVRFRVRELQIDKTYMKKGPKKAKNAKPS